MSLFLHIHPDDPQERLIKIAADIIRRGGIAVYPTDSGYALGCRLDDKQALARVRQIRRLDAKHNLTLLCRDLSEIATYAKVDNATYRLLKAYTPGAYTFLLQASKEVPRRLLHPKRKTIGIRVPDCEITLALLGELDEPLMTTTLILPGDEYPLCDPDEICARLDNVVDVIIDGGAGDLESTSVIDLFAGEPVVRRVGNGDVGDFL
jgi:tRNA threonylcarbamoyl adenosine modification protein (Sua5/YciO/YrdC/YwlC family)